METLFEFDDSPKAKKTGNPYHRRDGKFSNKYVARAEVAEKRAAIAENKLEYIMSVYRGIGAQLRRATERIVELETILKNK